MVVAVGDASNDFHKILTLNQSGAFLFKQLQNGADFDTLLNALLNEFEVDKQTAENDVREFLNKITQLNLLEN